MFKTEEPKITYIGKPEEKQESTKEVMVVVMKGEDKVKTKFVDYVKLGLGFYIGFNLGRVLKRSIIITNISK